MEQGTDFYAVAQEAKMFFERLSTAFVSASSQSRELETIKATIESLQSRITTLEAENNKTKADLSETWEFVRGVEKERDEAVAKAQSLQAEAERLNQVIRSQDGTIAELQDKNAERATRIADLETEVRQQGFKMADQLRSLDYWTERTNKANATVEQLERDLMAERSTTADLSKRLQVAEDRLHKVKAVFEPEEPEQRDNVVGF